MSFQAAGSPSLCTLNSCKAVYRLDLISSVHSAKTATRRKFLAQTYARPPVHAYLKPCKHVSLLATGQLRHQSATAPSLATHAADTVAAHQCHESDSDVIFTSHV